MKKSVNLKMPFNMLLCVLHFLANNNNLENMKF